MCADRSSAAADRSAKPFPAPRRGASPDPAVREKLIPSRRDAIR
ncbi:Uncharacterised protein [Amycolatopsis camponoti]|uniref:Uncharacterized protein n=1 Tax=Amycolatopsis camponoti TaxID=2606593 RepID=A0A6I8LDP8_9PSEU|nr:Uncharacterised protein [Amycolatopsis camponoti]